MLTLPKDVKPQRNPDLSAVEHRYLVEDEQGRKGIAYIDVVYHGTDVLFAHPSSVPSQMSAPSNLALPSNAIIMTNTAWHLYPDGTYKGLWYDSTITGRIREDELHTLRLIEDVNPTPAAVLGSVKSKKKSASSAANGRKGGRPKKQA